MSRTTLARDFVARVRETLLDQDYALLRYPEKGLIEVTNWGHRALAKYLPSVGARVDSIKLPAGTKVDLTVVVDTDIMDGTGFSQYGMAIKRVIRNMGANGVTPGRVVRQVELDAKDAANPDWHTEANGTVVHEWAALSGTPRVFYVSPPASARWIEIEWVVEPQLLPPGEVPGDEVYAPDQVANNVLLGIPDANVDELHAYVVAMCLLKGGKNNQNIPKSQVWSGIFINSLNALATAETGVNPKLKLLPFADEISAGA